MYRASSIIKNTRLEKDLEIAEISKKLKIPSKYLSAIEEETKKEFPPDPYCSLMVSDYANFLGLNGPQILGLFRRDFDQKRQAFNTRKHRFSFTPQFTFTISTIAILIIFTFFLISEYAKFNRPPKLEVNWSTNSTLIGNVVQISGLTDPESTVRINQDLVIVDSNGNFQKNITLSPTVNKITVESKSPNGKTTVLDHIYKSQ